MVDVDELLGIAVGQRKPRALHLHHDPVPAAKGVRDVGQRESHFGRLPRYERFGGGEAAAVALKHPLACRNIYTYKELRHLLLKLSL